MLTALNLESRNDSFQKEFLQRVREKMEKYNFTCTVNDNQLSFRRLKGFKFVFSFRREAWVIQRVPNGSLSFDGNSLTLRYHLDLRKPVLGNIAMTLVLFGPLFVIGMKGPLWERIGIVLLAALFMGVAPIYSSMGALRYILNKVSREMGGG